MKKHHSTLTLALVATGALLLTACGGGSDDGGGGGAANDIEHSPEVQALIDEAQEAGSITFYSMIDEAALRTVSEGFTERYGIDVRPVRLVTGDLTQRFSTEAASGTAVADLILMTHSPFFAEALQEEWITSAEGLDIPVEDEPLANEYWMDEGATPIVSLVPTDAVVNTDEVGDGLESWEDYALPEYRNQLLLAEPDSSPANLAFWSLMRETYGDDFLEAIADNDPLWLDSAVPVTQAVAAGEGQVGHPGVAAIVNNLVEQGAPVERVSLTPTTGPEAGIGISANSPNQAGAILMAAFLMSEEGNSLLNDETDGISPFDDEAAATFTRTVDIDTSDADAIRGLLGLN
ncbi:MAG: ABC transporter substrate-binding protein [Micrococcaceae bacterium]